MNDIPGKTDEASDAYLKGTTYKVYRYILKERRPQGISDIQRGLRLSSPSVAQYHIRKLLRLGLTREEQGGYVIDKIMLENVIRIRRVSIPIQTSYIAFFAVTLFILTFFVRPATINSVYFLAIVINVMALGISLYETMKTLKRFS